MMNEAMLEWRMAFAATQLAALACVPVTPQMKQRLFQASIALYDSEASRVGSDGEERRQRIAHVGEVVAARWMRATVPKT